MLVTNSRPFTLAIDSMFHFGRHIPSELKCHYTSPRIAFSLRTRSPRIAEARAMKTAEQLAEFRYDLRSQNQKLPARHMLRQQASSAAEATTQALAASVLP